MHYDAVVIGGGPCGAFVALKLSKDGFSVLLLEEHRKAGLPIQCAGLVTTKIRRLVDVRDCILNTVSGAYIYSPAGRKLVLDSGKPKAYVLDRAAFDRSVIALALDAGTELRFGTTLTAVKRLKARRASGLELSIKTSTGNENVRTELVIGADGAGSDVRKLMLFPEPKLILKGIGMEFRFDLEPHEFVRIYSGSTLAPGFFAWVIPAGELVKIGLCIDRRKKGLQDHFRRFRKLCMEKELIPDAKPVRTVGGAIPLGTLAYTTADNVMLVGDAAAQVKPTSGGGIYLGLRCAALGSEIASSALQSGDCTNAHLAQYHQNWRKLIGSELDKGFRLRRALMMLSDEKIDEAFEILDNPEILDLICKKGDIESPFGLAKLLFKKAPKLIKFAGPYFRSAFNSS